MTKITVPTLGEVDGTVMIAAGVAALLVVWYVVRKAKDVIPGALSGDNALTRGATNADGSAQTGYVGAGPLGTLGAATNAASGGYLSSFGDWLGGTVYDLTHADPTSDPSTAAANAQPAAPGAASLDPSGFDFGTSGGW